MTHNQLVKSRVDNFRRLLDEFPDFRYLGDPILRQKTIPVATDEGRDIAEKLGVVLVRYRQMVGYGRGLAAPQLGISSSVFVTYLNDRVQTYINPEITFKSPNFNYYRELCLSSAIMWGDIKRPAVIEMTWVDEMGKNRREKFDGVLARLLQHEFSHLLGEPNLDIAEKGTVEIFTSDPLAEKLRE